MRVFNLSPFSGGFNVFLPLKLKFKESSISSGYHCGHESGPQLEQFAREILFQFSYL